MYQERIKVILRQADPYNKTGDATKGGRGAKFDLTKTFIFFIFLFTCKGIISSILDYKSQ